jgi:hypothetical protein
MWVIARLSAQERPILIMPYAWKSTKTAAMTQGRTNMKSLNFLTHQEIFNNAVNHLFGQGQAALLPRGGGAYRGYCGGCPVGSFIKPRDYLTAMEGVPIRFIIKAPEQVPAYMDVGVAALKRALLRSRINVYDQTTVELLSCLQNVHDVFGKWEWRDRFTSIARQFGLSVDRLKSAA